MTAGDSPAVAAHTTGPAGDASAVAARTAGPHENGRRNLLIALLALFVGVYVASRIAMFLTVPAILDADSYKYLAGADSLLAGNGWPPVFQKLHDGGGALHAVPGYSVLLLAIWKLCGGPTFPAVVFVQGLLSLAGLVATIDLARRWHGLAASVVAAALLAASPSIAWLDQMVMPESAGAAAFAVAMWLAGAMPVAAGRRTFAAAVGSGVLMSAGVLLRTSAQVFVPFPLVVAALRIRRMRSVALWAAVYGASFVVPLVPWIAHNRAVHGHAVLSASTGRNLYFTGVWTNTIDREAEMKSLGRRGGDDVDSSYDLLDRRTQKFLDSGLDLVEADAAMQRLALDAYRAAGLGRYLDGRIANLTGLFGEESFGRENMTLSGKLDWWLNDGFGKDVMRTFLEKRWSYALTPAAVAALNENHVSRAGSHAWVHWWVRRLSFDDAPLAVAFVLATVALLIFAGRSTLALAAWAAPVVAYLVVYAVFGAPLYRYQAAVHAPMLAVIAIAAVEIARAIAGVETRARPGASASRE